MAGLGLRLELQLGLGFGPGFNVKLSKVSGVRVSDRARARFSGYG